MLLRLILSTQTLGISFTTSAIEFQFSGKYLRRSYLVKLYYSLNNKHSLPNYRQRNINQNVEGSRVFPSWENIYFVFVQVASCNKLCADR